MSHPNKYQPQTDFAEDASNSKPGRVPVDANALNTEFADLEAIVNQIIDNAKQIQRDDGLLADSSVLVATLSRQVINLIGGFKVRGAWLPTTYYAVNDITDNNGTLYVCKVAHTSGTVFDDASWSAFGFSGGDDAAAAAAQAANYAQQAFTSKNQSAASATAASGSATAANTSATTASSAATAANNSAYSANDAANRAEQAAYSGGLTITQQIPSANSINTTGLFVTSSATPTEGSMYVILATVYNTTCFQAAFNGWDSVTWFRTINLSTNTPTAWTKLQTATTSRAGIVQLSNDTNSASETLAATPKAVKSLSDSVSTSLNNKVDKVSGKGLSTNDYTAEDAAVIENMKILREVMETSGLPLDLGGTGAKAAAAARTNLGISDFAAMSTTNAAAALGTLGDGQSWQSVSRTAGTMYTNTTGRVLAICVRVTATTAKGEWVSINCGGIDISNIVQPYNGWGTSVWAIIPNGWTYMIKKSNGMNVNAVWEFR